MSTSSVSSGGYDRTHLLEANNAEREADQRIHAAKKRVDEAAKESDKALDHIRDTYQKQVLAESDRHMQWIESEKNKGYEQIRELQRAHQSEVRHTQRQSDHEKAQLDENYRNQLRNLRTNSEQQLSEQRNLIARQMNYEKSNADLQLEEMKNNYQQQAESLKSNSELQMANMKNLSQQNSEEFRLQAEEMNEKIRKTYEDEVQKNLKDQTQALDQIHILVNDKVNELRKDHSEKLNAYQDRLADPFYRLMDLQARLTDEGDAFVLRARVPVHEQSHFSVSTKGDNLVLSGYRRNQESVDLGEGHKRETAAYQAYHESMPLTWPVDPSKITKNFDGDEVTVRVPKKNEHVYRTPPRPQPEKARAEAPRFPKDLMPQNQNTDDSSDEKKPVPRHHGTTPLG